MEKWDNMVRSVYFWGGKHPIQETVIKTVPDGFRLISNRPINVYKTTEEYKFLYSKFKTLIGTVYRLIKIPRIIPLNVKTDLIYTWSGVIPLTKKPWIVSLEFSSSFVHLNGDLIRNPVFYKRVMKFLRKPNCKFVMPYSEACKKSFTNAYPEFSQEHPEKIRVIYPTTFQHEGKIKRGEDDILRILFIDRHFFDNGGRELLSAFNQIKDSYEIELIMITTVPQHHYHLFQEVLRKYSKDPKIHIYPPIFPRRFLFDYFYSKSDIFILPSYIHFYGFVILEAMSTGLPIITTNTFALPEIVENGFNGFIVNSPIKFHNKLYLRTPRMRKKYRERILKGEIKEVTNQLKEKMIKLIDNKSLRENFGRNSRWLIESGKFSIEKQKFALERIYTKALE